jgi:hypothetical protein
LIKSKVGRCFSGAKFKALAKFRSQDAALKRVQHQVEVEFW